MPSSVPPPSYLATRVVREGDGIRLILSGELDMNGVLETEHAVEAAAELSKGRLIIDLSELEFMDLFGARALLRAADAAITGDREVVIANPRTHARRLFELITDLARGRALVIDLVQPAG